MNYLVGNVSFCINFYVGVLVKTHLNRFQNSLYFMKHNPEVKIWFFFQRGTLIFRKAFLRLLDETRKSTSINQLGAPIWGYNTRKYSLGE